MRDLAAIFAEEFQYLRPRSAVPPMQVDFYPFVNLNNTIRLRNGKVHARLSDLLAGAPESVLRAIAHILLAKLYRKPIHPHEAARYRQYTGSKRMSETTHRIRNLRGRKQILTARGRHYDLEQIFDELNARFFHGLMARPLMTWSREHARSALGHYDPAHNTIVVSRVFDRRGVPRYAIEYLVYHEMLHLRHPVKLKGSRRCVHPPAFAAEEKLFPHLEDAKRFLKQL